MTKGKPVAGMGVKKSLLGTAKRGSKLQVTYNGHPLYTYIGDSKAGQATAREPTALVRRHRRRQEEVAESGRRAGGRTSPGPQLPDRLRARNCSRLTV